MYFCNGLEFCHFARRVWGYINIQISNKEAAVNDSLVQNMVHKTIVC